MFIDIDIKISDNDGNLLHRFEKQFDEEIAYPEKLNNHYFGEDFEDSLSEYMSFSGLAVRERLISDYFTAASHQADSGSLDGPPSISNELSNCSPSELEFRIRIGSQNIFIGRIPLKQLFLMTVSENPTKRSEGKKGTSGSHTSGKRSKKKNNYGILQEKQSTSSRTEEEDAALDTMLNYAMVKAIEKYEANLCPAYADDDECPDTVGAKTTDTSHFGALKSSI